MSKNWGKFPAKSAACEFCVMEHRSRRRTCERGGRKNRHRAAMQTFACKISFDGQWTAARGSSTDLVELQPSGMTIQFRCRIDCSSMDILEMYSHSHTLTHGTAFSEEKWQKLPQKTLIRLAHRQFSVSQHQTLCALYAFCFSEELKIIIFLMVNEKEKKWWWKSKMSEPEKYFYLESSEYFPRKHVFRGPRDALPRCLAVKQAADALQHWVTPQLACDETKIISARERKQISRLFNATPPRFAHFSPRHTKFLHRIVTFSASVVSNLCYYQFI